MKAQEADQGRKSRKARRSFHCGDFQKMAEMMKTFRPGKGDAIDCCSAMMSMMGRCKEKEGKESRQTRKPPRGGEKA